MSTTRVRASRRRASSSRRSHKIALVDLFSGCGGLSAGFIAAGSCNPIFAADTDVWANRTYGSNLGHEPATLDLGDLASDAKRRATWARELHRAAGAPLVLAGGPPCQGFSSHVKTRGDRHGRNELVAAFAALAVELAPDVVVMENVADLFAERNWGAFTYLRSRLCEAGYNVRARIVNLADFGVPQERFRAVVLAARGCEPSFPAAVRSPQNYSTVKEWIADLPAVGSGETDPDDPMHQASNHRAGTINIIKQVPLDGGSRPLGVGPACLERARDAYGGYTDVYGRLAWSQPAPTITARCRTPSCGRFVHPDQHRGLTAREAALLQTFPRDWQFVGPFDDRYKQIGNAVPPLAAKVLASHISAGFNVTAEARSEAGVVEIGDEPIGASFSVLIPGIRRRADR